MCVSVERGDKCYPLVMMSFFDNFVEWSINCAWHVLLMKCFVFMMLSTSVVVFYSQKIAVLLMGELIV